MTDLEMFERSFERPRNFLNLSFTEQWAIDKSLGLLDWPKSGLQLSAEQRARMDAYYDRPLDPPAE